VWPAHAALLVAPDSTHGTCLSRFLVKSRGNTGRAGRGAGGLARDPYHLGRDEPAYRIVKKGARGLPESVSRDGSCRIPIDVVVAGDDHHSLAVSSFKR